MESEKYNMARKRLVKIIGKINSVSNFNSEGHGRDDFDVKVLINSERLVRRISRYQS